MTLTKPLAPELRVLRDFLLLVLMSLLASSGYVSIAYQESYPLAILETLFVSFFMFFFSLMLIPEEWQLGMPGITLAIGLVLRIARRIDERWRGFCYWLVLMGWCILVIFGFDIKPPFG